jgi:hypothetical protein
MRRTIPALCILSLAPIIACLASAWFAARPPTEGFILPGAQNVHIQELGIGQRSISYDISGERYSWYFTIATRLERQGWLQPDKWGPATQINTYTNIESFWLGFMWEQVELHGEPNHARITLRRWITFPVDSQLRYVKSLFLRLFALALPMSLLT